MEEKNKLIIFFILLTFIFLMFTIKLFSLQVVSNYKYILSSIKNLENEVEIKPLRGEIWDRNDKKIAIARPIFKIYFIKRDRKFQDVIPQLYFLSKIFNLNFKYLKKLYKKRGYFDEFLVKDNVTLDKLTLILANKNKLPDVLWKSSYLRYYPITKPFFHLIGYVGEITKKELIYLHQKGYSAGDIIGKMGVEKEYDYLLKGKKGIKSIITNAKGEIIKEIIKKKPIPGKTLKLTINSKLQQYAYKLLRGLRGSVVIQNIKTGEILTLVSSPSIDPNIFVKGITRAQFQTILNNPDNPFLFRPIAAEYPASSIFKILMSAAGLNEKAITPSEKILCTGTFSLGDRIFKCTKAHGYENLVHAIKDSCNIYFYNVGLRLGIKKIGYYASLFGFGQKTGIDLPNESPGFIPTPEWKINKFGEPWFDGDTLNVSIGQGYLLVTVLQINMLTAIVANRGYNFVPHVLKEVIDSQTGKVIDRYKPKIFKHIDLAQWIWDKIIEGMKLVVKKGTARIGAVTTSVKIAGKTGTAQNISGEDHSWFTAFGPVDDPEIAITVMVENAGYGASVAAPIVATLFDVIYGHKTLEKAIHDITIKRYKMYGIYRTIELTIPDNKSGSGSNNSDNSDQ